MVKRFFILTVCCLLFLPCSVGCAETIKGPSVAGTFYPADKNELRESVERFLSGIEKPQRSGRIIALISPHAGYRFSGQVAAYGFKEIRDSAIQKVILIGVGHHVGFKGASVYTTGSFRTPLGDIKINESLAKKLLNDDADITFYPEAYEKEHSIEVQLPFLQTVLKDFSIVPILIGTPTKKTYDHLIDTLSEMLDEKTLIIASTDMSHYHDYSSAMAMDGRIISAIERLSVGDTAKLLQNGQSELCGGYPVLITMEIARRAGADYGLLFHYANSGDVTNEKEKVVGYSSVGFIASPLSDKEKKALLALAKATIEEYVSSGKVAERNIQNPRFRADGAVFVTIKKNGSLRGCIGNIQPVMSLYQSVIKNAIAASSADPRFPPVSKEELKDIEVEVSILSPLLPLKDIRNIQVGKHGLVIRKGAQSGVLLPQVATEFGWDKDTFLEMVCTKAGLPKNAWKEAELLTFTAEVIK
jgi:AmmeMemoRadiSam system protein B/AmmeMemoRadiSam system protein A